MYLVIAEKPSVSRAIAEVIGAQEREDGYLRGTDCMVSWCFGHLVEYVSPDVYDEKFSQWRYEDLPIIPKDWKVTVSEDKKDQFYILKRLLNSPEIEYVVNACDAGRKADRWKGSDTDTCHVGGTCRTDQQFPKRKVFQCGTGL